MANKGLFIEKIDGKPGEVTYPLVVKSYVAPPLGPDKVSVRVVAAALNHRDIFITHGLYPGLDFNVPLGSDAVGIVDETGSSSKAENLNGRRVIVYPSNGYWDSDISGPELEKGESRSKYAVLGATKLTQQGTFVHKMTVDAALVEPCPHHLSTAEAAAIPVCGLTAWRAVVSKGQVKRGSNVLITGIGGGVALFALQFAIAIGANVYVSSSSQAKIDKAIELGAKSGVNYKDSKWGEHLTSVLPKDRPYLDVIVDGAGGDILERSPRIVRPGGKLVVYGMTNGRTMSYPMQVVLANIDVLGVTMGSRAEFHDMIDFIDQNKIHPIVSDVFNGLESIPQALKVMENAGQFGKIVVTIDTSLRAQA